MNELVHSRRKLAACTAQPAAAKAPAKRAAKRPTRTNDPARTTAGILAVAKFQHQQARAHVASAQNNTKKRGMQALAELRK